MFQPLSWSDWQSFQYWRIQFIWREEWLSTQFGGFWGGDRIESWRLKSDRSRGAWWARARSRPRCRRGPARSHSCCSPDDDLYDDEMNVNLMPRRTAIFCFEKWEHVIDRSFYRIEDAFWNETHKTGMTCAASDGAGRRLHRRGEEASQYRRYWKEICIMHIAFIQVSYRTYTI